MSLSHPHSEKGSMKRALENDEILRYILSYLPDQSLANCARVCQVWSDAALTFLWEEISRLTFVLGLLGPLVGENEQKKFLRPPTPDDWARLDHYAWRVRSLVLDDRTLYDQASITEALVSTLPESRRGQAILPNLRFLDSKNISKDLTSLFITPTIAKITLGNVTGASLQWVDSDVLPRLPILQSLSLFIHLPWSAEVERSLLTIVDKLPRSVMRNVELPHNWLSPIVIERIAAFPNLTEFEAIHTSPQADDPQPFSTPLPVDSFPELKSLSIIVPYKHAISAFSQNYRPHLLTTLSIRTPIYEYSADFGSLTSIIGADCVNLEMLRLNSTPLDAMLFPYSIPHDDFVTFEHIQPLLRCRKLRTLSLFHNRPFQLSSDEVIALFAALPLLTHVYLNDTPDLNGPGLPLAVLHELPRHTRNLMFLQLYLDASVPALADVDLKPFKRLRILGVGHSLISDPLPVAKFLTRVLPEWCDIFCSTHNDSLMDEEDDDVRHEKWRTVAGLVKAMTIAREEGRAAVCRRDE